VVVQFLMSSDVLIRCTLRCAVLVLIDAPRSANGNGAADDVIMFQVWTL
jgi:hypothetical protein